MADHLSPQASKAMRAGEMKRRSFWPGLARQGDELILSHPHRGGYQHRADLASYVARELPQFRWDSKRGHWRAPLDALDATLDAFTQVGEVQLRLSGSLTEGDVVVLTVEYESSKRYLRSGGQIVEVRRNGDGPRPPRGSVSPDEAGRVLEARGYRFAGSQWLDRDTSQPRQEWTFERAAVLN